ncbi:hypothetical protein PMZ80_010225 [Knufia obscura]|nr:hypothetical protein PMZ80_010225 [Knufia obscura]
MSLRVLTTRRTATCLIKPAWNPSRHTRSFFGLGEIMGVLTNPAETLRQLNKSKDMLKKAKEDMQLADEAKKIPRKHTFSRLPGFHGRKVEQALLRKIFSNNPKLTVLFGATSVGKTALLREVLATEDYYVIRFDLRISGFANLRTLYIALCEQFQEFFETMHDEEMEKQKLTFKHLARGLMEKEQAEGGYAVTVADLANLMESLQSASLKYWEYDPKTKSKKQKDAEGQDEPNRSNDLQKHQTNTPETLQGERSVKAEDNTNTSKGDDDDKTFKKRPIVFLMDEAHKLPALVDDQLSLKVLLDTLLVLTKQDRLCHVLLSTSDSFFHHFLRKMNVGHHAQLLTVGDCTREDTHSYFKEHIMLSVPASLASRLEFEPIYEAFGGKLAHINNYVSAWVNADGKMTPYISAIFIQAYTLLQFHLTRAKFETYSPLSTAIAGTNDEDDDAKFTPDDLLYVMRKMVDEPYSMPYFGLCREIGTEQVDSMIKTRILELRWTKSMTPEQNWVERKWSEDGVERPVVLPMTRIIRRAMEVVLREEAGRVAEVGGHEEERREARRHKERRHDEGRYQDKTHEHAKDTHEKKKD